jgi:hypothetical protein
MYRDKGIRRKRQIKMRIIKRDKKRKNKLLFYQLRRCRLYYNQKNSISLFKVQLF